MANIKETPGDKAFEETRWQENKMVQEARDWDAGTNNGMQWNVDSTSILKKVKNK